MIIERLEGKNVSPIWVRYLYLYLYLDMYYYLLHDRYMYSDVNVNVIVIVVDKAVGNCSYYPLAWKLEHK